MFIGSLATLLLAGSALAGPLVARQNATAPITSANGTTNATSPANGNITASVVQLPVTSNLSIPVVGYTNKAYNVSSYLGIPFAKADRFRKPELVNYAGNSTYARGLNATKNGLACMQSPGIGRTLANGTYTKGGIGEDCLNVNVFTPAGVTNTSGLPVVVWFFGGGFINGANTIYDGTAIIAQSVLMRSPVILVVPNYRLNIYGWLNGAEALANNATNLGLRDQLAALEWVQEYAKAFGGDPKKVTIQGESAGAISIALHMLNPAFIGNSTNSTGMMNSTAMMNTPMTAPINSNSTSSKNSTAPFRGAIMQSGAMSTFPIGPANETRQPIFDRISLLTGCSRNASLAYPMANGTAQFNQTEFECLRTLPNDLLFNATRTVLDDPMNAYGNFPFGPTIDFDLVPASPAALLAQGKFAKNIPFISGNMLDEGTLFTPPTINTTAELTTYIDEVLPRDPNSTVISTLLSYYNNPADGSPFGTGNSTFGLTNISPLYKQVSALFGDTTFQSSRRNFLQSANEYNVTQTWSYLFSHKTNGSENSYLGASHGSDVFYAFGQPSTAPADIAVSRQFVGYFINFANTLNPNGNTTNPLNALVSSTLNLTSWPAYSTPTNGGNANMLQFGQNNLSVIQDTYRQSAIAYINSVPEALNH